MALDKTLIKRWQQSDILLLAGSAGAFKIIYQIISSFPHDLNKTVIIIIHRKKNYYSEIEKMFSEKSRMFFHEISDKDPIKKNSIYIAPANYHLLIENGNYFSLDVSDAVWFSKPSIDVTFESAADVFNKRCTAILFSGANQDGAHGLLTLRNAGALTIVQNPEDAEMPVMPTAAIDLKAAEYVLHTADIFGLLACLIT